MAIADENARGRTRREIAAGLFALPLVTGACASLRPVSEGWPLWSVEKNGTRVYLTGATPSQKADWRDPRIEAIADSCDLIWTETNQTSRGNMRDVIMRLGVDASAPLSDRIPEADWVRVKSAAALNGVAIEDIDPLRPWLAAHTIGEASDESRGWGGDTAEIVIAAAALQAGKEVRSEFAFQEDIIEWFGQMTAQQSLEFMRFTLDEILAPVSDEAAKFDAWARGDTKPAADWIANARAAYPAFYEATVTKRNRDWVARFDSVVSEKKSAIAIVGLYHLVGPDSIQENLSRMGFAVRRVTL